MEKYLKERLEKYDVERDMNGRAGGDYGHRLADMLVEENEIENAPRRINKKVNPLEKTIRILKETNPDLVNFGNGIEFDRILRKIAKTGYEIKNSYGIQIKDFSRLDGPQKRELYLSLKRQILPKEE